SAMPTSMRPDWHWATQTWTSRRCSPPNRNTVRQSARAVARSGSPWAICYFATRRTRNTVGEAVAIGNEFAFSTNRASPGASHIINTIIAEASRVAANDASSPWRSAHAAPPKAAAPPSKSKPISTLTVIAVAFGVGVAGYYLLDGHTHTCEACGYRWRHLGV